MKISLGEGITDKTISEKCLKEYANIKKRLGQGAFGTVYQMCKKPENSNEEEDCRYAVKTQDITSKKAKEMWEEEAKTMKFFSNKIGVGPKFIDWWDCEGVGFIVTEMWNGSLKDVLDDKHNNTNNTNVCEIIKTLEEQVKKIHNNGYIHGDIKSRNILVKIDENNRITDVTITDFGNAKKMEYYTTTEDMDEEGMNEGMKQLEKDYQRYTELYSQQEPVDTANEIGEHLYNIVELLEGDLEDAIKKNTIYLAKELDYAFINYLKSTCPSNDEEEPSMYVPSQNFDEDDSFDF